MGAANYETIALGKTSTDAFNAAVSSAQYEYGHGGYTGTIAEKAGYGFNHWGELPARMSVQKFIDLVWNTEQFLTATKYDEKTNDYVADPHWTEAKFKTVTRTYEIGPSAGETYEQREFDRYITHCTDPRKTAAQKALVTDARARAVSDKWGHAHCVEIKGAKAAAIKKSRGRSGTRDRVFLFFGLASS